MAKNDNLTADYVRQILEYNPENGVFYWKRRYGVMESWNVQNAGKSTGWANSNGYLIITIAGKRYRAHRLAWVWMTGEWPEFDIDHIDRNRTDNRWCNLREATRSENHANRRMQHNNKLGFKGVHIHRETGKYRAQIRIKGKSKHIGLFRTAEEAHAAYIAEAKVLYGEFARGK